MFICLVVGSYVAINTNNNLISHFMHQVPYGNTFVAWTQYTIINTGKNTCRMICSVEAEFPNGAPMVARQESPR